VPPGQPFAGVVAEQLAPVRAALPQDLCLLDRAGREYGRGPRPVRRAAAHHGTGFGPEHPGALVARADLAHWTGQVEDGPRRRVG